MMATHKPMWGSPEITTSTVVSWSANFETLKLNVRFLQDIDIMYSCTETNTYVLTPDVLGDHKSREWINDDSTINLLWDLQQMNGEALPFGQIVFLSYYSGGEFVIESGTERWLPTKVAQAFESFGYFDVRIIGDFVSVCEKDKFKLKLKFGY